MLSIKYCWLLQGMSPWKNEVSLALIKVELQEFNLPLVL